MIATEDEYREAKSRVTEAKTQGSRLRSASLAEEEIKKSRRPDW